VQSLWADLDAKLWPAAANPKETALTAVETFPLRPSVLVDSGGGLQAFWRLAEPESVQEPRSRARFEQINQGLARAVCGPGRRPDAVHDATRLMRLPGTWNLKPEYGRPLPVRALWCRPDHYPLEGVERLLQERYAWTLCAPERTAPAVRWRPVSRSTGDLREKAMHGGIRLRTLALLDRPGPAGYRSPSESDAAVTAGLIRAGLAPDEVLTLLLASPRGQDALQRKGRYAAKYWARTLTWATTHVHTAITPE
jgi:hypothetical protein